VHFSVILKFQILKKKNKKFLNIIFQNGLYKTLNHNNLFLKILLYMNLFKYFLFKNNNIVIKFYILIKEKHELKNFLLNFYFINYIFNLLELSVFLGLVAKKSLRKKKNEKKLILKKKIVVRRKKRTNNQILKSLIKKYILQKQLYYNLIFYKKKFKGLYQHLLLKNFNVFYFINFKFNYLNELFYDLDVLYVRYLPRNRKLHFINVLMDDYSDLWRGFFNKNLLFNLKFLNYKLVSDFIGDIKLYNNLGLDTIYKLLINSKKKVVKYKKKYFLLKNIFTFLRFHKNNNFMLKNLDFIFNIYF